MMQPRSSHGFVRALAALAFTVIVIDAAVAETQIAQRPPIAETALQRALRLGGVRLSTDEIRTLLFGATIYYRRPGDGATGITYIGQDGRWRARNILSNGQTIGSSGTIVLGKDAVCFVTATGDRPPRPGCPSADSRARTVVRQGPEIVYYFLDEGTPALVTTETRRGNPENL
jgi:hypothetical protein